MAGVSSLHALTSGLAQYLTRAYQLRPIAGVTCKFESVGVSDFKKLDGQDVKLTLLLYRLTHNEHQRNRAPQTLPHGRSVPLTINAHLLVTVWADTALKEQSLIAWAMRELHMRPVLDRSLLADIGNFSSADLVPLLPEELSLDDMSKLWQVLTPPMRPSLCYVARNVMVDLEPQPDRAPVVATRFEVHDPVDDVAEGFR